MAAENYSNGGPDSNPCYLQKFGLYSTCSNFYMIGRDKNQTVWRVLKIHRLDSSELTILEDPTTYSEFECFDLLRRIHDGNRSTGGLNFVTACYGIVGFVKFLGPYYMLLIKKRRKIGSICGHNIYAVTKSEMIPISNSPDQSNVAYSKNEKSYSYNVMDSLQRNLCKNETGLGHYETMFVWNEFLTRGIRNNLNNTLWTVALAYGFFKQVKLSVSGRDFMFTLIARRSRHYAGTRYLKRGVNEKGRVANDVETEQIVFEDVPEGCPTQISSVVQNRGSIPLFWSQETSRLNLRPDIILSKKDPNYDATRLHFENLVRRYGNPIIILNLIKRCEKKPRETILRAEFANSIRFLNNSLTEEDRLRFLHWDLSRHSRKATKSVAVLSRVADYALNLTGIFYCQVTPNCRPEGLLNLSCLVQNDEKLGKDAGNDKQNSSENVKPPMFQNGVLRTNCIDCLDRTNVAQYAHGLMALGRQLHAMSFIESHTIDQNSPLVDELMTVYEEMGDTLALQYGGSAAHNKIFCQMRGQWKAATQSQEFFRTLQRYYRNAYLDAEKQRAINLFLGHFQPQQGKPALWELDSDQHYTVGSHGLNSDEYAKPSFKRSLSDGNILYGTNTSMAASNVGHLEPLSENLGATQGLSDSSSEMPTSEISYSSLIPRMSCKQLFGDMEMDHFFEGNRICFDENGDECNCTNFDMDWLSSSGNSCDDDTCDRSTTGPFSENIGVELKTEIATSSSESGSSIKGGYRTTSELTFDGIPAEFSEIFVNWVTHGDMLIPIMITSR
ncbi:phosphoinositide phosphatase SAC2 isoform X2 [Gossypium hirsutum]|uniref:Phosphoinositide phosphatase SAC2 isoform X2 n=1 Tax=Gossypium hirsutum TaxID=3635 RepID=A0A1U8PLM3_GOSHI|nr:phosphoinositide phosphatase SAC2 isoform X2 [Gossypium hirsutum]